MDIRGDRWKLAVKNPPFTCYWHRKEKHVADFFVKEAGYFRMTLKM
jgi:hypothetical protein